jgi:Lantibiotic dehydratase, N terminus
MTVVAERAALQVTPGIRLAPYALVRIAALPSGALRALAPPETTRLVRQALNARQEMERLRPMLEDVLYCAVPAIHDRKTRAAAIALRRHVHNGRLGSGHCEDIARIVESLEDRSKSVLRDWSRAQMEATESLAASEAALAEETESHTRPRLWALSADRFIGPALALSSPELLATIERTRPTPPRGLSATKTEKSLLRYLIRAGFKTSPFSTFMHVALLGIALDRRSPVPEWRDVTWTKTLTLNRGTLARIGGEASARFGEHDDTRFQVNTTIRDLGDGRLEAIVGQYIVLLGRPWRQERVSRFRFHPTLAHILLMHPGEYRWTELVHFYVGSGLDVPQAGAFVAKLLERGLIWPEATTDGFDPQPEVGLLRKLASSTLAAANATGTAVAAMQQAAIALTDADGNSRHGLVRQLRTLENEVLTSLTSRPITPYRNVVLENSAICGATGAIGGKLPDLLREVGTFLQTQIAVRPDYIRLRDAFVHIHGVGGTCHDLVGFMMKVGDKLVPVPEMGASAASMRPDRELVTAAHGATLGVTAYVQVAAADPMAAAAGDALIVVNRVFEGVGWLTARFAAGAHADHGRLRAQVREWLAESVAPCEPVDLIVGGECNDLQAHPQLTSRVFGWPGEPLLRSRAGVLRAETVSLHHNTATGFLELTDAHMQPIALVYLGSVLPSPTWGIPYALTVLAQPHYIRRPDFSRSSARSSAEVVYSPRRTEGHLVLMRARWFIRASRLKTFWFSHTGARRLLAAAEECQAYGIPECFFATAHKQIEPTQMVSALDARKPLWIDTRNPFCLELFERIARDVEWVILTEALPGIDQSWAVIGGEQHVSELQVEMMVSAVHQGQQQ